MTAISYEMELNWAESIPICSNKSPITLQQYTVVRDAEISPQDPKIFVFKIEPGARSYMPGDPFGPKKPSISPYWDFAVTWQTSSWLKNGDFSRKKWYLLYGP